MKRVIIALIALSSVSSFAATNLTCGVFQGNATGKPIKRIVMDLDQDKFFKSVFISSSQTFSAQQNDQSGTVTIGFSEAEGNTKTVLSKSLALKMEGSESVGVIGHRVNDKEKTNTAVCYLTGESDLAPFDL